MLLSVLGAAVYAASWDYSYECNNLPESPICATTEPVTGDVREAVSGCLHIVDSAANRSLYQVDLSGCYSPGIQAGTIETMQQFVSSSNMNNIILMMRQDTNGASAEIRIGYYDAGDGRKGLWNANTGQYLGPTDPNLFYKIRMVLDGPSGGRLFINDSCFAHLDAIAGGTSRLYFGANSTLGTGEVNIDYFRWKCAAMAAPGDADDPGDPSEFISPRTTSLPTAAPEQMAATITWTTDVPTDSTVRWGTAWTCPNATHDDTPVTNHSVRIEGLQLGTTYRFYVESSNSTTYTARSGIQSFATQDTFRISSGPFVRTAADGTSATVSWNTPFTSDSKLFIRQKGLTSWNEVCNQTPVTLHALGASELIPNTEYEYYVVSTRVGSTDAQSQISGFFTYVYDNTNPLLSNSSFELGNTAGWSGTGADVGVVYAGPKFDSIMPHSGNYFLCAESSGGAKSGAVYQTISSLPKADYVYASVWIHTYETDSSGNEEHNSAFCQIGIDTVQPASDVQTDASTIKWSAPVSTANTGPWVCIGVNIPLSGSDHATVFLRHVQTADGGFNATCFDDATVSVSAQTCITTGPAITMNDDHTSAAVEWTTSAESTSFIQYGNGTADSYQFGNYQLDLTPKTAHRVEISIVPGSNYVLQIGSATPMGISLSAPMAVSAQSSNELVNSDFEAVDSQNNPTLTPWTVFQYDIDALQRFASPGQPAGGPIDGLTGPYPYGGSSDWHGVTCESDGGTHFIGAYSEPGENKNGGVYQQVKVSPSKLYKASMRFLTRQDPIDFTNPAEYTACAIAIDPTGGTDVLSSSLIWSQDKNSATNGQWEEVAVSAQPKGDVITVFCIMEQRYDTATHVNAIDNVKLKAIRPVAGILGKMKQDNSIGGTAAIESAVVTCVHRPEMLGQPIRIYIEDLDRSCGIGAISTDWNLWSNPPAVGESISVHGTLTTVSLNGYPAATGEAAINDAVITRLTDPPILLQPLALTQRHLGGGTFGIQPGVTGGSGLSNIGLLIKTVGKVTSGDSSSGWITDADSNTCIYIDDGSKINSGTGIYGIKIVANSSTPSVCPLAAGDMVMVTGISTVEEVNGSLKPVLILQMDSAISVINQQ